MGSDATSSGIHARTSDTVGTTWIAEATDLYEAACAMKSTARASGRQAPKDLTTIACCLP